jgi:hypothetical protein
LRPCQNPVKYNVLEGCAKVRNRDDVNRCVSASRSNSRLCFMLIEKGMYGVFDILGSAIVRLEYILLVRHMALSCLSSLLICCLLFGGPGAKWSREYESMVDRNVLPRPFWREAPPLKSIEFLLALALDCCHRYPCLQHLRYTPSLRCHPWFAVVSFWAPSEKRWTAYKHAGQSLLLLRSVLKMSKVNCLVLYINRCVLR